jgi:hypothetical protein
LVANSFDEIANAKQKAIYALSDFAANSFVGAAIVTQIAIDAPSDLAIC